MARPSLTAFALLIFSFAAAFTTSPAVAQFDSIFRGGPPRPPADVPSQPPSQQPPYYPGGQQGNTRSDVPPAQPLPAPMNLPPSSRPGAGSVQSQPLAAPPGAQVAPQAPKNERPQIPQQVAPQGQQQTGPTQALPGLPLGQRQPRGPGQPAENAPQPGDEVVVEPPPQRIANPTAVFSGLDKITGRITSFDVAINETVQFGALQVTPRACYSRPPTETPNTDAFVEVDEVTLQGEIKRIFTGWMFASSPGLHAIEHPIYDVWLTDCKGAQNPAVAEAPAEAQPPAKPATPQPPKRPARRPQQQPAPALR